MTITRDTPWRTIGPVMYRTWESTILNAGGPQALAGRDCWLAAADQSGILLNKLRAESSYGSRKGRNDPALTKNPFSLRRYIPQGNRPGIPDSQNEDNPNGYLHFQTWAEGVEACRLRITVPEAFAAQTYNAVNPYPATVTLADLIYAFSPPGPGGAWNDTERIIRESVAALNQYDYEPVVSVPPGEEPMPALTFGRVPHPPFIKSWLYKPPHTGSGWGYDYKPNGRRSIVGMVWHEWMDSGPASQSFYTGFFACPSSSCPSGYVCANGARCANALTDYYIMRDGTIVQINDPRGKRSPWASGGGGPYEGDGPAFVSKFGVAAVNERMVSVEICKTNTENYTPAQIEAAARLGAYWHDQDGQAWDEHPYTSKHGVVTSLLHFEVGNTTCGRGELDDITRVQARTKAIMREHQESISVPDPIPPDVPPQPEPAIPGGLTLAEAKKRFGEATRHRNGQVTAGHGFDPKGPISLAWAHRAAIEQEWPKIEAWYVLEDSGETFQIVTFSNDWRLVRAAERAAWEWMDFKVVELPNG